MCSQLVRLLLVGAVLGTHAIKVQQTATPTNEPHDLIIRYALLSPNNNPRWLNNKGVPQLESSLCLFEQNFVPAWEERFGAKPTYMIYTDENTHTHVSDVIANLPYPSNRFLLRNLDEEHANMPYHLLRKYQLKGLDDTNRASVRREFADVSLPTDVARLLVGTDVMVLHTPTELLDSVANNNASKVFYLADRKSRDGLVHLANYEGEQCPGLKADFMYFPPNVGVTQKIMEEKLDFYLKQPINPDRQIPDCWKCVEESMGYKAADEYAWMIAIPEVATCEALSWKYAHQPETVVSAHEIIHGRRAPAKFGC